MKKIIILLIFSRVLIVSAFGENEPNVVQTQKSTPSQDSHPFQPGSAVQIICFPDTAAFLSRIYPIDSEGCIELPLLGRVSIALKTKEEFVEYLNTNFLKYLRNPGIQVKPLIRVAMLGGFQRPGIYYISPQSSFSELLQVSGPPIREDGLYKMRWERNRQVVKSDLVKSFESAQSLKEMGIESGDQICVTPKPIVTKWEIFRGEVLPLFSFAVTTAITSMTLYFTAVRLKN
jgi:protein involved in polysaccharide export with SLBB domain